MGHVKAISDIRFVRRTSVYLACAKSNVISEVITHRLHDI